MGKINWTSYQIKVFINNPNKSDNADLFKNGLIYE